MTKAERTLTVLKEAARFSRETRGRRGYMLDLDDADEVIVAGDLHGHLQNFHAILAFANLGANPRRHLVLQEFVHGSRRYPGGGCTSHQLLDVVALLKCQYPQRVHLLAGNHELAQKYGRTIAKGGVELTSLFDQGVMTAFGEHAAAVLHAYDDLFDSMLLGVRTPNRILMTHSVPPAERLKKFSLDIFGLANLPRNGSLLSDSLYDLLWGRDIGELSSEGFARLMDCDLLITGHVPCEFGFWTPNRWRLIVDCAGHPAACVKFSASDKQTMDSVCAGIHALPRA